MEQLNIARQAAELAKIPVEHFLCANAIFHALSIMNPEDPLRPSHFGMLFEAVDALEPLVLGPDDEESDGLPPPPDFENEAAPAVQQSEPGIGAAVVDVIRNWGKRNG